MNNTNQNHTDNFFKQGLSSPPEITPSEKNWEAMERLLKPETKKRAMGWIYISSGIAAALLIFLSLWLIPQKTVTNAQQEKAVKDPETGVPAEVNAHVSPPANTEEGRAKVKDRIEAKNSNWGKKLFDETGPELTIRREQLKPAASVNVRGSLTDKSFGNTKVMLAALNNTGEDTSKSNTKDLTANDDSKPRSGDLSGKWALGFAVSPDLNSVAGIDESAFGISLGAGLSYKLGKAVSIGTGVYYSQKLYSADKTSYKVKQKPFATWTSYSNRIDADCRVIDIPVNLSFRVSNGKQNKLYATAGLSSYIMLSEKYDFIYNPSPAYPTGKREYTVRNQNKHILSVMNLGVAMEKPLNSQMSLVIQPYAKIPLTGIGQGETDLKSFGVGLKLNYSLKRK